MNLHYSLGMEDMLVKGIKKHTIRKRCLRKGMSIHHIVLPYRPNRRCVLVNNCTSVQKIHINPYRREIKIDDRIISNDIIIKLSQNDGFATVDDFWKYFNKPFEGFLIHWTNIKY